MFSLSELRTVSKDPNGLPQYGVFSTKFIAAGTVIWREEETHHKKRAYFSKEWIGNASVVQIKKLDRFGFTAEDKDDHLAVFDWIAPWILEEVSELPLENRSDNGDFFNHSCDPNVWWLDEYTIIARRDIYPGEELCYDYGTEDVQVSPFTCFCGTSKCRKIVGGEEWRRVELQQAYGKHFKPFLLEKIAELRSS